MNKDERIDLLCKLQKRVDRLDYKLESNVNNINETRIELVGVKEEIRIALLEEIRTKGE